MVDKLAVFLVLQAIELVRIADKSINHSFEDLVELLCDKALLEGIFVITADIAIKESIQKGPKFQEIVAEVFPFHVAHSSLAHAGIKIILDLSAGLERIIDFPVVNTEVELLFEIAKDGVVKDNEFLVNIDGFILYSKIQVIGLSVFYERVLLNGFVPVNR